MKNLLIYVNPTGFDNESEKLTKIQIENSLELGWLPPDILLVTNFPYSFSGIDAYVVNDGFCDYKKEASKITTMVHLFNKGFFEENELYWSHDLDAYQLELITEEELGLDELDGGFCDYGRISRWQMGSFFFKKSAEDIFRAIVAGMRPGSESEKQLNDEDVMVALTEANTLNINSRIARLNNTYDFGMRRLDLCYEKAEKPLKVLHFHPESKLLNTLAIAMYGRNSIKKILMNERLVKVFKRHGYY